MINVLIATFQEKGKDEEAKRCPEAQSWKKYFVIWKIHQNHTDLHNVNTEINYIHRHLLDVF